MRVLGTPWEVTDTLPPPSRLQTFSEREGDSHRHRECSLGRISGAWANASTSGREEVYSLFEKGF